MMFLELVAVGGVTYVVRKRSRPNRLIDHLAPSLKQDCDTLKKHTGMMSEEEKAARRYFLQTSVMFACGVTASLTYPPLLYVLMPGIVLGVYPIFRDAYTDLTEKKRVTVIVADAAMTVLTVAYGTINPQVLLVTTFSNWLYALMLKILATSKNNTQDLLEHLVLQVPSSIWVMQDDIELEVPFSQVKEGDTIIVDAGQQVPADGVVVDQTVFVNEYLLTGNQKVVEKTADSEVLAGSVLQNGRLKLRVKKLGDATGLARLRQSLENNTDFVDELELRGKMTADRFALPGLMLGFLAYPVGGLNAVLAVLLMTPFYNMRLLGILSVMDYLQEAVRAGVLIKDGRILEQVDNIDTLVLEWSALKQTGVTEAEMINIVRLLDERGITLWLVSAKGTEPVQVAARTLGIKHWLEETETLDRLELVERLQMQGSCLGYIGDGVDDAILMKASQVSISVSGVYSLANDTADIVLLDRSLHHLNNLFELAARFEASMSRNLLSSSVPNAISIVGTFTGSIGYLESVIIFYTGLGLGLSNVFWPQIRRQLPQLPDMGKQSKDDAAALKG